MANALYPKFKESCLSQSPSVDLDTDTIKVALWRGGAYNSAHQYLSDLAGSAAATAATLGSKTVASGVFDAADVTFSAVAAGASCSALVIYKDTGVAGTSALVAWIDLATNLPITPNGGDITITWDNGANKIFAL